MSDKTFRHWLIVGAIAASLALIGIYLVLSSPTGAPSAASIDYLAIVRSLSPIETRVASELKMPSKGVGAATPDEVSSAIQASGGLVRSVVVGDGGAISVRAMITSLDANAKQSMIEVALVFKLEQVEGKEYWRCHGTPKKVLPTFCRELEEH